MGAWDEGDKDCSLRTEEGIFCRADSTQRRVQGTLPIIGRPRRSSKVWIGTNTQNKKGSRDLNTELDLVDASGLKSTILKVAWGRILASRNLLRRLCIDVTRCSCHTSPYVTYIDGSILFNYLEHATFNSPSAALERVQRPSCWHPCSPKMRSVDIHAMVRPETSDNVTCDLFLLGFFSS